MSSSSTKTLLLTTITASFSFILGLAWNNLVQYSIDKYVKKGTNTLKAQIIYTIIVTLMVIIGIYIVSRLFERVK